MKPLSEINRQPWLGWFLKGLLVIGFFGLMIRLFELQVIKGSYFHSLAEDNRIRSVPISAPRGRVLDRRGEVLVGNIEVEKQKPLATIKESKRVYPLGESLGHISGYLSQVTPDEAGKVDARCPEKGPRSSESLVGRGGVEQEYGCHLRGIDGTELVEVDTMGTAIRTLGTKSPIPGQDLKTTIDIGLQKKLKEAIEASADMPAGRRAAVVATDINGGILGFYSSPSFDPAIFLPDEDNASDQINSLLNDPDMPLFDRVIGGAYHPGSIYKIVTSIAALEEARITKDFLYDDPGVITINKFSYATWYFTQYGRLEGKIDLPRAIARSTDTFFYVVGEMLGAQKLAEWSGKFGLGKLTGIDLPGEIAGLIPTPEWKKKVKGENWFLGNTYHISIGQGDMTTTPLQANLMTLAIANSGSFCRPHIALGEGVYCQPIGIQKHNLELVKEGMIKACQTGGTAYPFFDFSPQVACKTGTAETEEEDKTHAWFTVFAPIDNPEIILTILVEKGGEGSGMAAPIARDIMDYWFHEK